MVVKIKKINRTFILVIPRFEDIHHSYYASEIIKGVGLAASRLKTDILMHITDQHEHRDWLDITNLNKSFVDGILFADINGDIDMLRKVISKGIPYMVLNNTFEEPINSIHVDNEDAAYQVVQYLIKAGHKAIATITGDLTTESGKLRLEGYKKALRDNHIKVNPSYIISGYYLRTPARKAAIKLLSLKERPTAIFAASDVMALEVIDTAKAQNIRVPDDLSIIGFDDNPLCTNATVKLTTVSQPLVEMGRLALEHLNQIVVHKSRVPIKVSLKTKFIERESVKTIA